MGRSPCCAKEGLNRGAWTALEDKILVDYIKAHGEGRWRNLPRKAGLKRCGKSCRLRWLNYLRPDIKRGNISPEEEELIIRLHKLLGNRWSLIAGRLPGRTDNEIKNYWNTNLVKKVKDHQTRLGSLTCKTSSNKLSEQTAKKVDPADHQQEVSPAAAAAKDLSSPPKMATQVVRTKAIKCSKVIFIDQKRPDQQPQVGQWLDPSTSIEARSSSVEAQIPLVEPIESAAFHGLPTFASGGNNNNSDDRNNSDNNNQDLMLDFMADFLDTYELSDFSEFSYHNDNGNDFSSSSSHQPMATMLPEEMLQDWSAEASCDQPAAVLSSSLNSLSASFFDSEEEWLVEY